VQKSYPEALLKFIDAGKAKKEKDGVKMKSESFSEEELDLLVKTFKQAMKEWGFPNE
jgi:hypothetical protein